MKMQKTVSKLRAALTIVFGYVAAIGLVFAGFQPGLTEEANSFTAIAIFAILILGMLGAGEYGISLFKQASAIKEGGVDMQREGASAGIAKIGASLALWTAIPAVILTALFIGIATFSPLAFMSWDFAPNALGFAGLATVLLHFVLFKPYVYKRGGKKLKKWQEKEVTQVRVIDNGLEIKLMETINTIGKNAPKIDPIRISFDEITDLRVMNLQEAKTFSEFEIGPDVKLAAQSKVQLFKYLQGKITRPSVYAQIVNNATLSFLLIQGEDILYLFTANEDDAKTAQAAWQNN